MKAQSVCGWVCVFMCLYVCLCVYTGMSVYMWLHMCMYRCMSICVCLCMSLCVYVYVCLSLCLPMCLSMWVCEEGYCSLISERLRDRISNGPNRPENTNITVLSSQGNYRITSIGEKRQMLSWILTLCVTKRPVKTKGPYASDSRSSLDP